MSTNILDGIIPVAETSDMTLVTRIREVIQGNQTDIAQTLMSSYSFWYGPAMLTTSQVYWSENHYIMNCSCELLLREMLYLDIPDPLLLRLNTYLNLKNTLGFAEFLSPVYWPYTITSLLNMYDFTQIQSIKTLCQTLLDKIASEVLTVTLMDGSTISPSGRSYLRNRVVTTGLHISLFIQYLMTQQNIIINPGDPEMALRTALSTTTYKPSNYVYNNFNTNISDITLPMSPHHSELLEFLNAEEITLDIYVSLLWNHGAYVPTDYPSILKVLMFMDQENLWQHPHFIAISKYRQMVKGFSQGWIARILTIVANCWVANSYALGGLLTDATVQVHREGTVTLSSLINFNSGLPAFQQWPWAVNLNGIPIWCNYGSVGTSGLSSLGNAQAAAELSTAAVMPYLTQTENKLVALYRNRNIILDVVNRKLVPIMYWTTADFDDQGVTTNGKNTWTWAKKGNAVMAYIIIGNKVTVYVRDLQVSNITLNNFLESLTL